MIFNDKPYNGPLFLDELIDAGVAPDAVRVKTAGEAGGDNLTVTILVDDTDGSIAQTVQTVAANHDASGLSIAQRKEADRDTLINFFDLDKDDRDFIISLSRGLRQAAANDIGAAVVYDNIRAIVDGNAKHQQVIYYWFNIIYGVDLSIDVLTTLNKRQFVEYVQLYYATQLAPALTVWMAR